MILFDIEALQNLAYNQRGIGRYVLNLACELSRLNVDLAFCYNSTLPPPIHPRLPVDVELVPATSLELTALRPDWIITGSPFEVSRGVTSRLARECIPSARHAVIVYDLIPYLFQDQYLQTARERNHYANGLNVIKKADLLLTISDNTKTDIERYLNLKTKCITIGAGVESFFRDAPNTKSSEIRWAQFVANNSVCTQQFLFTVSGAHYSKNLSGLLSAYAHCPTDFRRAHPLVIGGGIDLLSAEHLQKHWKQLTQSETTIDTAPIFIPKVDDFILRELYRRCSLFVYASKYEGFGLPLAEALISGAVSCTVQASSLNEIITDSEFTCPPNEPIHLALLIEEMTHSRSKRQRFHAWRETASKFLWSDVATNVVSALEPSPIIAADIQIKHRYAIVGPLLPERTGIADYNTILMPYFLATDIFDWFTPHGSVSFSGQKRVFPISVLSKNTMRYAHVIYVIGNSHHHLPTLQSLIANPGIVWLHDVTLDGLAWDYAQTLSPSDPCAVLNSWAQSYELEVPAITGRSDLEEFRCGFARPLLKNASGFIVHSDHARKLLRRELGGRQDKRTITVVPLSFTRNCEPVWRGNTSRSRIRIGMVGFMAHSRYPELVLSAAQMLKTAYECVDVSILGFCPPELAQKLTRYAAAEEVSLTISGYVDGHEFEKRVSGLDVLVQLRTLSKGESSATISLGLELGIPIVTNLASALETFDGAVTAVEIQKGPEHLAGQILLAIRDGASDSREATLVRLRKEHTPGRVLEIIKSCLSRALSPDVRKPALPEQETESLFI